MWDMSAVEELSADAYAEVLNDGGTRLFIGDKSIAANLSELQRLGINYIVNATSEIRNYFQTNPQFQYLKISVIDSDLADLSKYFDETLRFITEGRESGHNILVHCQQGMT